MSNRKHFYPKYVKNSFNSITKIQLKNGRGSEYTVFQRRHTNMKRCSTSLIIREKQITITMSIISHVSEWLLSKRQAMTCCKHVKRGNLRILLMGMYIVATTIERVRSFFKKLKIELTYDLAVPFLLMSIARKQNTNSKRYM